jgi:hypothetical protein
MVPPGDNLEFFESPYFKKAISKASEIRDLLLAHLQSWPASGVEFAPGIRELEFRAKGRVFAVIFRRTGNRLGLMYVFELPRQESDLKKARLDVVELFGRGKGRQP